MAPAAWRLRGRWTGHAAGLAGAGLATVALAPLDARSSVAPAALCYQVVVLAVSGAFGAGPGLVTALASALALNWFFLPPTGTLTIAQTGGWVSLGVFAATAVVTGQLAALARRQRVEAEQRGHDAELMAELGRAALADIGAHGDLTVIAAAAARALGVRDCDVILSPGPRREPSPEPLTPGPDGFAIPLLLHDAPPGILRVGPADPEREPRWARADLRAAVAALVALAVERGALLRRALEVESLRRSDELKTALLRSVSHEFRTPLTAVRTAGEALAHRPARPDAEALLDVVRSETERLQRLVANLLDLSRLEAGALSARPDWCAPDELVAGAVEAAAPLLAGTRVATSVPSDLPLVRADAVLCERILVNLLQNAVRHGAPPVRLSAGVRGERLELAVEDAGGGPAADLRDRLFEPFSAGGPSAGSGVGLALARGLARAQGGTLRAEPGGARFVLSLPLSPVPEVA